MSKTTFVLEVQDLSRQAFEAFKAGAAGAEAQLTELQREVAQASATFAEFQTRMAAAAKFTKDLNFRVESIGKTSADLVAMQAAQLGVTNTAAPMIQRLREAEAAGKSGAMSAAAYANALRMVPAQMTDIVVSLQSGQKPMTVLMQQGGQLKDMFGGIGPAAKAMGGYVLGMVNPFTLAAAAAAGLGYAMYRTEGSLRESNTLAVQLQATGREAQITQGQMLALRDEMERLPGVSKSAATGMLLEFARARQISEETFRSLTGIVADFAAATGTDAPSAAKKLAQAFADPVDGAKDLDKQFGILTASQLVAIQKMADMGDRAGAQKVLFEALAARVKGLADDGMTPLSKATNELGNAWDNAMRSMGESSALRGANDLLAKMIGSVTWLLDHVPQAVSGGGRTGALAGMAAGGMLFGPAGAVIGNIIGSNEPSQTGGATGSWATAPNTTDDKLKALLDKTSGYKSAAAEMQKLRGDATALADALKTLQNNGDGASATAKLLADRLAAVREQIASKSKKAEKNLFVSPEALETAKGYAKWFMEFRNLEVQGEAETGKLTEAQKKLIQYLSSPEYANASEGMRQIVLQEAYGKVAAEQHADAVRESAKAYAEFSKAQAESESKDLGGIVKRVQDLKDEAAAYGKLESQIQRVKLARMELDLKAGAAGGEDVAFLRARVEEQRALVNLLEGKELREANKRSADASAREWEHVGDALTDNLMRGGKSAAQYLKDLFRTLVLRPMLAPIGQAVAGVVGSAIGVPAMAQSFAGSATGSAAGAMAGSSLFGSSMIGTGVSTSLSNGMISGFGMNMTNIGNALAGGQYGLAFGNALPYLGAATLAASLLSGAFKGETRSGGKYIGTSFLEGPSGGEINGDASRTAIGATMSGISGMLKQLGASATLAGFESGFESSKNGKGFAYAGGRLSTGAEFGQLTSLGYMNRRGSMSPEEAAAAFGEELKQATLQALQAADVPGQLGDYLRQLGDIDKLSGGALDAALAKIQKALSEKATLEDKYFELTHTALEVQARDRQRERDALDESNRALYDQIAALQDQKVAAEAATQAAEAATQAQAAIDQQRYDLETQLLELQGNTAELRRRELEKLDPANRALQERIWLLQDDKTQTDAATAAHEALLGTLTSGTDGAYSALERAVSKQRDALQTTVSLAQEQVDSITGVFGLLKDQIRSLYDEALPEMTAAAGRRFIDQALATAQATGYLPDQGSLAAAIASVRGGMGAGHYATAFEMQRDQLLLASKLSQLQGISGKQLTSAERQLSYAKGQLQDLDNILTSAREQIDALRGIDTSVLSVKDAIDRLAQALAREAAGSGRSPTGGAMEQWVQTATGQMWQSAGGAVGVADSGGFNIYTKDGLQFTGDQVRGWVNDQLAANDPMAVYQAAVAKGISANSLDKLMGWTDGTSNTWAANVGVPAFADGGDHAGGLAWVGERGRELAYMPPARIYNAEQSKAILAGDPEVPRLLRENVRLQRENQRLYLEMITRLQNMDGRWKKFDNIGMPKARA